MKKRTVSILFLLLLLVAIGVSIALLVKSPEVELYGLRCQKLEAPIGVDIAHPSFSWQARLKNGDQGFTQAAYQLLVATSESLLDSNDADVWNTGKVASDRSTWVNYEGINLKSNTKYYWKVLVWAASADRPGNNPIAKPVAQSSSFQTGLLHKSDWKAKWIGLDRAFPWDNPDSTHSRLSARYFRKVINIKDKIQKATLYFTGLGLYKLYFDGKQIGNQELSPIASDYCKRVYYNVFDVTKALSKGDNAIGVILGNGEFFSMRPGAPGEWKEGIPTILNFGYPKLLLQLEIDYENGKKQTIISDGSWKVTADGPIRSNNIYDGEVYDYSKQMPGWNTTSFDDTQWKPVDLTAAPGGTLQWQQSPNMKRMQTIRPVAIHKQEDGRFLVDMGQNMVGWVHLKIKPESDSVIVLRYGERLDKDGRLYTANLRSAHVTDSIYGAKGKWVDWRPSFVYHGFQYVEINGVSALTTSDLVGEVVYDNMKTIGSFSSSDSTLNQIYKAAWWTISGNYKGMPVDCPQRDERMGWLGDRSMNCYGESFLFDNYQLYAKWLGDIADAQQPNGSLPDIAPGFWPGFITDNMTWPSSYLFVTSMLYHQFGDKHIVAMHYDNMKKWMDHMLTFMGKDSLVEKDNYGDWCMPPESPELILSKDTTRITPGGFIGASYYIKCLDMMSLFAGVTGKKTDSIHFSSLRRSMIKAINKKYFNQAGGYYANNTVTANLLALAFDLVPASDKKAVAASIARVSADKYDNHVSTGLIGDQWLMRGLTNNGYADIAFKLATNTTYPSWGYMLKEGASTIWELWNGNTANPAMNSGNHVMLLGDLLIWYYENLAGIKAAAPGFKEITMRPLVDCPLEFVKASYESPYGEIKSHWQKQKGNTFIWDIEIPANTTAMVYVPADWSASVAFSGNPEYISTHTGYRVYKVHSGRYHINSSLAGVSRRSVKTGE